MGSHNKWLCFITARLFGKVVVTDEAYVDERTRFVRFWPEKGLNGSQLQLRESPREYYELETRLHKSPGHNNE